jgi:hypothetical protein
MFKKSLIISAALAFVFSIAFTGISFANNGPAEITLKTDKAKKPAVFPHKKHQDKLKCAECHHTQAADGKQGPYKAGEEKKCESCHNEKMANEKLNNFMKAGHANCKDCHKAKGAPTKCDACHPKK